MARLIGSKNEVIVQTTQRETQRLDEDEDPSFEVKRGHGTLSKAVEVVHMYPMNGDYSLYTRRVFNMLLFFTMTLWKKLPQDRQSQLLADRGVLRFGSSITEIEREIRRGSDSWTNARERVYQAIEKLYRLEFRLDVMRDGKKVWMVSSRLISQWAKPKVGSGEVEWEFPPDIFELLMRPERWANIDLMLSNSLKSGSALALAENTGRYISNPSGLTQNLPVGEWIRLIVTTGRVQSYEAAGGYRYFKRSVLKPAMKELAASHACDFELELIETFGPRNKVTHLQFRVKRKVQASLPVDFGPASGVNVEKQMRDMGLTPKSIDKIICDFDEPYIEFVIIEFKKKVAKGGIKDIPAAFYDSIVNHYFERPYKDFREKQVEQQTKITKKADLSNKEFMEFKSQRTREYHAALPAILRKVLLETWLTDEGTNETEKSAFERKGFESSLVQGSFFAWLARQEGVLTKPEEQTLEVYRSWKEALAG